MMGREGVLLRSLSGASFRSDFGVESSETLKTRKCPRSSERSFFHIKRSEQSESDEYKQLQNDRNSRPCVGMSEHFSRGKNMHLENGIFNGNMDRKLSDTDMKRPDINACPYNNSDTKTKEGRFFSWLNSKKDSDATYTYGSHDSDNAHEVFNERNMMPNISNYSDYASSNLSRKREMSSIPKTGENSKWEYPSCLQFSRALELKGKQADSDSMPSVVYIHNFVNEESWKKILAYEDKRHKECPNPSLSRFIGRSDDLTLSAKILSTATLVARPFDRHDWFIDRCGKNIRYIIDYYDDSSAGNVAETYIYARPAPFDSFENFFDTMAHLWDSWKKGERP